MRTTLDQTTSKGCSGSLLGNRCIVQRARRLVRSNQATKSKAKAGCFFRLRFSKPLWVNHGSNSPSRRAGARSSRSAPCRALCEATWPPRRLSSSSSCSRASDLSELRAGEGPHRGVHDQPRRRIQARRLGGSMESKKLRRWISLSLTKVPFWVPFFQPPPNGRRAGGGGAGGLVQPSGCTLYAICPLGLPYARHSEVLA